VIRETLQGLEASPPIAIFVLVLFVIVFVGVVIWTLKLDRGYRNEMSKLPLDAVVDDIERNGSDG